MPRATPPLRQARSATPALGHSPKPEQAANSPPLVERYSPRRFKWTERLVRLFGKMTDPVLARRAGLSLTTVAKERRRRGIEPFQPRRPTIQWTAEMIAVLGTDTDRNVGAMLRIPPWSVSLKRSALSIPPYVPPPPRTNPGHLWTASEIELLGTMPDQKLADLLDIDPSTVMRKRHKLGIAPCKPQPCPIK